MGNQLYKMETIKFGGKWWATLYLKVMVKEVETWEPQKHIYAENYQALLVKIGENNFIDLINQNPDAV